jgi:hypothetical protein
MKKVWKPAITAHGEDRVQERIGLPKRAIKRLATKALNEGITHSQTSGALHKYLSQVYLKHHKASGMKLYGEFIWIFKGATLLTVLNLPNEYKVYMSELKKKLAKEES